MYSRVRPTSELFINNNVNSTKHATVSSGADKDTANPPIQSHPSVLKPRRRHARLSRIPVRTVAEETQDDLSSLAQTTPQVVNSTTDKRFSSNEPSVLDILLLSDTQNTLSLQKIGDLYNTALLIVPPYLVKQLSQLEVMEEAEWVTQFPKDGNVDDKIRAVQSLLIELGLVVARLSEIVKRERAPARATEPEVD